MRLSKITTRTGDDGTTGLADGSRIQNDLFDLLFIFSRVINRASDQNETLWNNV